MPISTIIAVSWGIILIDGCLAVPIWTEIAAMRIHNLMIKIRPPEMKIKKKNFI